MKRIRTAVIGVGVQGQRHAEKLAVLPASQLEAIVDLNHERADAVALEFGVKTVASVHDLIGSIDAAVLATPASTHFEIATMLLENGIHILLEKPIATTLDEARELVTLAEKHACVLQVGHLERFNPVTVALAERVQRPQFIESTRLATYNSRALDVSVVLDLMIHDIDLIHSLVRAPMAHVDAIGRSVFSDTIDVANARIHFANDCVANITSSRISLKVERTLRVFEADSYVSGDLHNRHLTSVTGRRGGLKSGPEDLKIDKQSFSPADAMMAQSQAFLESIAGGAEPLVGGRTAIEALETAMVIGEAVARRQPL